MPQDTRDDEALSVLLDSTDRQARVPSAAVTVIP
jgi:hypothetical protein